MIYLTPRSCRLRVLSSFFLLIAAITLLEGCTVNSPPTKLDNESLTTSDISCNPAQLAQKRQYPASSQYIYLSKYTENLDINENEEYSGLSESYDICINFPQLRYFDNKDMQEKINKEIRQDVRDHVKNFHKFVITNKDAPTSYLTVDYEVTDMDDQILSVRYYGIEYGGGAHGNHVIWVENFDLTSGRPIKLENFFKQDVAYKDLIKEYVLKDLERQFSEKQLGGDPDLDEWVGKAYAQEFSNFNISMNGIIVNFTDEHFMAYLWGGKWQVEVPYQKLKGYLNEKPIVSNEDFQNSLQEEALREVGFDKNDTVVHKETFMYLGYVISHNKKYHIGNFETIWGDSWRSTKRIIVFSEAGNYVGDYGLPNSFPTAIIDNRYLLFPEPTLGNLAGKKIDFSEGIPNEIFFDGENISFDKKYPVLFL